MNSIRWMICCMVALGVFAFSPLLAQEVREFPGEAVHDHDHDHDHEHIQVHDHHQQVRDRQKASFQRHLAVRITELKRVGKLDDKQVKKLEVASKGAVEEAMKQFLQRFPQLKDQAGVQPLQAIPAPVAAFAAPAQAIPPAAAAELQVVVEQAPVAEAQVDVEPAPAEDPPAEVPPPAAAEARFADVEAHLGVADLLVAPQIAPAHVVWNVHQNFQMEPSEAANTVVWRNAVKRVLTDEQMASYRKSQTDRRFFKRQTIVDRVVASVDRRLFLSDQQRKALSKVIHDTLGENLDNMVPHGGFTSDAMVAAQVVGQIPKEKLKGVLEPAQIESWSDVQHVQNGIMFGLR